MYKTDNHQYITYFRARDPEVFYVDGSYSDLFLVNLKANVPARARTWDKNRKRWVIQKEFLTVVKSCAKDCFDVVYYGEGGDYVKI